MDDLGDAAVNFLVFFVLFCLAGALYTQLSSRSKLLKSTVGLS